MLIDSGFAPEWISLDKEIRQDVTRLREDLLGKRRKLGPNPLTLQATVQWNHNLKEFEQKICSINKKIDKFNMIVPILNKQKVHFNFQKEVNRTVENYGYGKGFESEIELKSSTEEKNSYNSATLRFFRKLLEACSERFFKRNSRENRT